MEKTNLPIILLRGIIVLPYAELKIDLIDELDTKIIELASENHDGYVLLVSPNNFLEEKIEINKLPKLGVVGKITKKTTLPNGCIRVTIEGKRRAGVLPLSGRCRVSRVDEGRRQDPGVRHRVRGPDLQQGAGQEVQPAVHSGRRLCDHRRDQEP